MDLNRIETGLTTAALAAVVLLLVMFLSWFQLDSATATAEGLPEGIPNTSEVSGDELQARVEESGHSASPNAWDSFAVLDIVLLISIAVVIGAALLRASTAGFTPPVSLPVVVGALGLLATALVLFRLIVPPDLVGAFGGEIPDEVEVETEVGRQVGVFLGFIASAAIAYGGWRAIGEQGTSPRGGSSA